MGQYYRIINLDKKEFLNPYAFGDGAKLLEFGASGSGEMCGLAILLADGNGQGGGDLFVPEDAPESVKNAVGSWAGDRIVISGDYAEAGRFIEGEKTLYQMCKDGEFKDISDLVIEAMCHDECLCRELVQRVHWRKNEELPECLRKARSEYGNGDVQE